MFVSTVLLLIVSLPTAIRAAAGDVDCRVSVWSQWKFVGAGLEERRRIIIWPPQNGGQQCPDLTETRTSTVLANAQTPIQAAKSMYDNLLSRPQGSQGRKRRSVDLPRDFLVILDSSGSITDGVFSRIRPAIFELVVRICGGIGADLQNNRIAILSFGSFTNLDFQFNSFMDKDTLQDAIDKIPYMASATCTGDALMRAADLFTPAYGARPQSEAVREVLLITDGESNCGAPLNTSKAYFMSRNEGTAIFTVYAGASPPGSQQSKEISFLTTPPLANHLFHLQDFNEFFKMVDFVKCYDSKLRANLCVPYVLPGPAAQVAPFCPYRG